MKVLILNPSVGLTSEMFSLFSFFRIVVFPALSSPLKSLEVGLTATASCSQEQDTHFLLFLSVLSNNCQ